MVVFVYWRQAVSAHRHRHLGADIMRSPMAARTASSAPALVLCDDLRAAAARLRRGLHLLHRLGLLLPCSLALVLGRAGLVELPHRSRLVMRGDGADAEEGCLPLRVV